MLKWLVSLVDDARIAFAYLDYERECKTQWLANAERTYSTVRVEKDIRARMAEPMRHVANTFNTPIRELEFKRENIQRVVSEANEKLAILERDYKKELDAAYQVQNKISGELEECRHKLSRAYDDLNSAKRNLDSWYSKAEGNWFGNGGKKLPKRAIFGQDLSDRDHYKARKESAARDVGRCKSERSTIAHRLDGARATVRRIKDARQAMIDLKKAGFDKRLVTSTINNGSQNLRSIGIEISHLEKCRDDFLHQAKITSGVYGLENEIERLKREKGAHINAFDIESLVLERKAKHRAGWLAKRGR